MAEDTLIPEFTDKERLNYIVRFGGKESKFRSPEDEYRWSQTQYKKCHKCQETKSLVEFGFNTSGSDPFDRNGVRLRRGECAPCGKTIKKHTAKAKKDARENGIPTKPPKDASCALCDEKHKKMVFDHDHEKGVFRGWLCDPCNRSLGMLAGEGSKSVCRIIKALNYINKAYDKKIVQNPTTNQVELSL